MPLTIRLTLPAGRYHATPWGRHVNEGAAEWPPSPWRLLRAIVAVWKRTAPAIPEDSVRQILAALLPAPQFALPVHRIAHTRHYMPWEKKGPSDRTLVFDTFVSIDRDEPIFIGWPGADLTSEQRVLLSALLANLTTLGRAESWVHAELTDEQPAWNCLPADEDDNNPVLLFCPDPATAFTADHYPMHDPKKLAKGKVPPTDYLFDCPRWHLCLDTETLHARRWPTVPGARWIAYRRPVEQTYSPVAPRIDRRRPTVAQFVVDGPVLPRITETIRVAEAVRRAAMSQFGGWCRLHPDRAERYRRSDLPDTYASPTLSGKDGAGNLLPDGAHAYYLPLPDDSDPRHIRTVTVIAGGGFDQAELAALAAVRQLPADDDAAAKLRTQLVGTGQMDDFGSALFGTADRWISLTPFLAPAHVGRNAQDRYIRKALRREWRRRSLGQETSGIELLEIEPLPLDKPPWLGMPSPNQFRRARWKHRDQGYRPARVYRLTFSRPVRGPLCLGYGCHFGLGLFVPDAAR